MVDGIISAGMIAIINLFLRRQEKSLIVSTQSIALNVKQV